MLYYDGTSEIQGLFDLMKNMNLMKIGIVTCIDYTNYGNRLQNYALNSLLCNLGFQVKSGLLCDVKEDWVENSSSYKKKQIKKNIPFIIFIAKKKNDRLKKQKVYLQREKNFIDFTKKYMDTFPYFCVRSFSDLANKINESSFDYFIAGSDQIWNPYFGANGVYFLAFTEPQKRLSFAASIGVDSIPSSQRERYKKYLSQMKLVSVRESQSVQLVSELCGRSAEVTLDPTLLLSRDDWAVISKKPDLHIEDEYICTYFLGEVPEVVDHIASEKKMPVYKLNSEAAPDLFAIDPGEFVYMISHASMVLTDSFHAAAFSIIFQRDFYIFKRKQEGVADMFSRLESLTAYFDLTERIQDADSFLYQQPISNKKWKQVDNKRKVGKENAINMLLKAISQN